MSADRPHSPSTGRKIESAIVLPLSRDPGPSEKTLATDTTPTGSTWPSQTAPTSSSLPGQLGESDLILRKPDEATQNSHQVIHRHALPSMAQLTESLGESGSVPPPYHLSASTTTDNRSTLVDFGKCRKRSYEAKPNHVLDLSNPDLPLDSSHISTGIATHAGAAGRPPSSRSLTPLESSKHPPSSQKPYSEGPVVPTDTRQNPMTSGYGRSDPNIGSENPEIHGVTDVAGYRRDMEHVEDLASRLYHFAASAGALHGPSQACNMSGYVSDGQKTPNASHLELALQHCRSIAGILQTYVTGQSAPLSSKSRPPPRLYNQGSTSSTGDNFPTPPPGSHDFGTTFDSGGDTSWDYADEQAMKYRKRSAPKRLFGLGGVPAIPVPIVSAAARPQNMHVARQALPGRCHSCNIAETPEWRRGPDGARTLCNACGLHFAKLTKRKQQSAQGRNSAA